MISCSTPPAVDYCIHSFKFKKFYCSNSKDGSEKELTYQQADKYISISPDDYRKILDYIDEVTERMGVKFEASMDQSISKGE